VKKRFASVLLAVAMTISLLPAKVSAAFSDVQGHWAQAEIEKWCEKGIIHGYDGLFRPNEPVTRAEMAVMLDRIMNYQEKADNSFNDLGQSWYTDAILRANAAGIMVGSNGNVRPEDNITREEAAVVVSKALRIETDKTDLKTGFKDNDLISAWAKEYVLALNKKGYVKGDLNGYFNPKANITRAEVVAILNNSIKALYTYAGEYSNEVIEGTVIINAPFVVLKNMEIKGDLIIAEGVGDGDVTLDNIKISGNTIVKGGGENSVYFNSVTVGGALVVNKVGGDIRIVASGTTRISVATLESGAILITRDLVGGGIEKVVIPESIAKGQNIVLQGNFNSVENNASDITIEAKGKIENLILNEKTIISGEVEIKTVTTAEGADSVIKGETISGGQSNVELTTPVDEKDNNGNGAGNNGGSGGGGSNSGNSGNSGGNSGGSGSGGNSGSDDGNDEEKICKVTFDTNGGSVVSAVYLNKGERLTLPEEPIKEGVDFIGWYVDAELTEKFDSSKPVTSDITLYAKWSGWQEPVAVDSRFAEGYPKASTNKENTGIDIRIKLKGASVENPMEVFMVVNYINSNWDTIDSTAVIHGHSGSGDNLIIVDDAPYIKITDEEEHVVSSNLYIGGNRSVKIYFVIRDTSKTSATPTMIEFTGEITAELDQWPPYLLNAYINNARDKVILHFSEELDTVSVPQPEDFTLSRASVADSVYSVQSVNIYNTGNHNGISRVELTLSEPVGDVDDLLVSYNGKNLRDVAAAPNIVNPIVDRSVSAAGLSVKSVDVSHNGQYIWIDIDKSVYMERNKYINVILKYGADASSASTLQEGKDYIESTSYATDGSGMEVTLKLLKEPKLIEGYKYFITIDPNGLKDYAGDDIPVLSAIGVPNETSESEIIPKVVYQTSSKRLLITFPKDSNIKNSGFSACFLVLTVGGKKYNLRGYAFYDSYDNSINLRQENIPLDMDSVDWQNAKISYTLDTHPEVGVWYRLTFMTGMPYQGFNDVSITVE